MKWYFVRSSTHSLVRFCRADWLGCLCSRILARYCSISAVRSERVRICSYSFAHLQPLSSTFTCSYYFAPLYFCSFVPVGVSVCRCVGVSVCWSDWVCRCVGVLVCRCVGVLVQLGVPVCWLVGSVGSVAGRLLKVVQHCARRR